MIVVPPPPCLASKTLWASLLLMLLQDQRHHVKNVKPENELNYGNCGVNQRNLGVGLDRRALPPSVIEATVDFRTD